MLLTIEQMQQRAEIAEKRLRFLERVFMGDGESLLYAFGECITSRQDSDSFVMVVDSAMKATNFT